MYNIDIDIHCCVDFSPSTFKEDYNPSQREKLERLVFQVKNAGNLSYIVCNKTDCTIEIKTDILSIVQENNGEVFCEDKIVYASFKTLSDKSKFKLAL